MSNRIASCPQAKQIVGQKNWMGWAQAFAFPGFKANWVNTWDYPYTGTDQAGIPVKTGSTGWTYSCDGGAISGSAPNFNAGDLVLLELPGGYGQDSFTGNTQTYPKCWVVYKCIAGITGSATDPAQDTAHFAQWDYNVIHNGDNVPGPSGWPSGSGLGGTGRLLASTLTDTAHLDITVSTELDNWPLYSLPLFWNTVNWPWQDPNAVGSAAAGTFTYDWSFPSRYDGTTPTYTGPGTAPSTAQAKVVFPNVPTMQNIVVDPIHNLFAIGSPPSGQVGIYPYGPEIPGQPFSALVSWSFSSAQLVFQFAAWTWLVSPDVDSEEFPAQQCSTPATVTQTITLGGATYSLSQVSADATTLMNATSFSDIAWNTSWTNTYSPSGAVVSSRNFSSSVANVITASCAIGTPVQIKYGADVAGQAAGINGWPYTFSKALADVCGNYCLRTYNCPTVTCVSGNVDGFAPVEIDPPGTAGQSKALYANCQCT
jgi:hypothetical protein